jgi:predicted phosphoadenosine phosphosulfate sulfurtransferase
MVGLRADESMRRYRIVAMREYDNYISVDQHAKHVSLVKPIYDWRTDDVWTAPQKFGWDYNRTYDIFTSAGIGRHDQRVCPPYGEEPLRGLYQYATCFPELWERMCRRVPGAATAARYSQSPLYAHNSVPVKPADVTWQAFIREQLMKWPPEQRSDIAKRLQGEIKRHNRKTNNATIPDTDYHPESGVCWDFLLMIAVRGDTKGRKQPVVASNKQKARAANAPPDDEDDGEVGRF